MILKKSTRLILSALALSALAACNGDDGATGPAGPEGPAGPPGPPGPAANNCPFVGNITPEDLGNRQCQITGVLTEDATLTSDITWFLEDSFQVGNDDSNVTLEIDAGTQVRGSGTDHLLVWPGSALEANGTSADPIHFLSDDDGVDGTGEWGGLFLRGFNGLPTLTGTQGANRLDYVVVAEAGATVPVTIDGQTVMYSDNIVLNGVDSNTTLTFVQSHNSARDGFHILNGDPRMSWLLATGATRDGVWYRDFTGLVKDLMVIHNPDSDGSTGRSGIYASETEAGNSNPRFVNVTLVGRDNASEAAGDTSNEFGILFADNTDQIRMANVLVANFRNGCFEADSAADLSAIDTSVPGPNYLDGLHCANEAGPNPNFGIVRDGSTGFPAGTVAANNSINGNGVVYYNGAAAGITFTGEIADRTDNFTAGWYLNNIGGIANGLAADSTSLNAFLDGDTNNDGIVDSNDTNSPFIISDNEFNSDVADDTFGYDLTHIGAVRGGAVTNTQFDGWTVATGNDEGFAVQMNAALIGDSECPADVGGAAVNALPRAAGRDRCEVSGVMTTDGSLTSNIDWELEGRLQVGNDANQATLTIASGTRVLGDNVDAVDHLLVWPGSAIDAQGTSARPVRFSSDDADVNGTGEWGGLFLRGFNGISTTGTQGENSLDYVVVSEAGDAVDVTIDGTTVTYEDNIVLNGVDSTTTLTFVQSHNSARDGFHILNGDPRMSWLLSTGAGRDGVWYRDFNGLIKDLMVIHNRDTDGSTGRSGIYASETVAGGSNPRIVNATLVGRDNTSVNATADAAANEFGILFADNTDQIRMANVLIANFRNGCFEADSAADLSAIDTVIPGPNYLDGLHCANEAGPNGGFGVVRAGATGFPAGTVAANNSNGNGLVYYNGGATAALAVADDPGSFNANAGSINFTGEIAERRNNFTSGWYLNNILGISNGLVASSTALNGFLDGDTNMSGVVDVDDTNSSFIISDMPFNQDVADDTFGYDMTHVGAVRGGAISNVQFDNWTVSTHRTGSFTVNPAPSAP
ncbi:hypothetical protein EYS14_01975 [Alteromonadaceae bacterium M269]|nr:hypothetical protein EYS14_01975 [Alteromonadaceae bacterium M269]